MHWNETDLDDDMEDIRPRSHKPGKTTKKHDHWPEEVRDEKEDRKKDRRLTQRRRPPDDMD